MFRSMARPMSHGPPACESAPITTSTRARASERRYGRSSPSSRRAVSPLFSARSWGVRAMDSMLRIATSASAPVSGGQLSGGLARGDGLGQDLGAKYLVVELAREEELVVGANGGDPAPVQDQDESSEERRVGKE